MHYFYGLVLITLTRQKTVIPEELICRPNLRLRNMIRKNACSSNLMLIRYQPKGEKKILAGNCMIIIKLYTASFWCYQLSTTNTEKLFTIKKEKKLKSIYTTCHKCDVPSPPPIILWIFNYQSILWTCYSFTLRIKNTHQTCARSWCENLEILHNNQLVIITKDTLGRNPNPLSEGVSVY